MNFEVCRDTFEKYPVIAGQVPALNYTASHWSCMLVGVAVALATAGPIVAVPAPDSVSLQCGRRELRKVAAAHEVLRHREDSCSDLVETLVRLVCTCTSPCARHVFVFQVQILPHRDRDIGSSAMPQSSSRTTVDVAVCFHYAVRNGVQPQVLGSAMRERPCGVCARLTPLVVLTHLSLDVVGLSPPRPGERVTRAERAHRNEPVAELSGPVLYASEGTQGVGERARGEGSPGVQNPKYLVNIRTDDRTLALAAGT